MICLVFLGWFIASVAISDSEIYYPTEEEVERGFLVRPSQAWGYRFRKEKSIRMICVGGSTTESGLYPEQLDSYFKANISTTSYAFNRGVGGTNPTWWIDSPTFGFESRPHAEWPNLFSLEYAVNTGDHYEGVHQMDILMQRITSKFHDQNLSSPNFLIIEVPHFSQYLCDESVKLSNGEGCNMSILSHRIEHMQHYLTDQHHNQGMYHAFFSRRYQIPYISVADSLHASFMRFFFDMNDPFKYPFYDCHLTEAGHNILTYRLIVPMLEESLKPQAIDKEFDKLPTYPLPSLFEFRGMTFTKDDGYDRPLEFFRLGNHEHQDSNNIIVPSPGWEQSEWKYQRYCYLSYTNGSIARFRFHANNKCGVEFGCQVKMFYLRSWNTTKIGDLNCTLHRLPSHAKGNLFRFDSNHNTTSSPNTHSHHHHIVKQAFIEGNRFHDSHTIPVPSILFDISGGDFEMRCLKPDDRLSCVSAIVLLKVPLP